MRVCLTTRTIKLWLSRKETSDWADKYSPNSPLRDTEFYCQFGFQVDHFTISSSFGGTEVPAKDLRLIAYHHLKGMRDITNHPEWSKIYWPKDHE